MRSWELETTVYRERWAHILGSVLGECMKLMSHRGGMFAESGKDSGILTALVGLWIEGPNYRY